MRSFIQLVIDFVRYKIKAGNQHVLHSPFLFEFYTNVILKKETNLEPFSGIIARKKELEAVKNTISVTDYGAGSHWAKSSERSVSTIAKSSKKALKWQLILYRIVKKYYTNATILELGTSLGCTTAFLATANPSNQVITLEGCPEIAKIAQQTFDQLTLKNIEISVGNIDETLPQTLNKLSSVDVVFFDANHRYEPTIRYFETCLAKATENSCFIFDDIYWSNEMKLAWKELKNRPEIGFSIDFFQLGILFFRKKQPTQHYTLSA